ncbi:MAG: flagellar protein FlgN [Chloroflexi bacterium]|nr:flagellar protein FlgN [Chloroflexota bacterium]
MELQLDIQDVSGWDVPDLSVGRDGLGQLLDREVAVLRELVDASMAERAALMANDIEQLVDISRQKEALAEQMEALERGRRKWMERAKESSGSYEKASLDSWLQSAPRERKMRLAAARAEMAHLVRQLMEIKEGNRLLLETSLEQVQVTVRFLLDVTESSHGYAHNGLPESKKPYSYTLVNCQV